MSELEVIKNAGALTCSGELSRLEQILFNSILAITYNDLPKGGIHEIPLEELLSKSRCSRQSNQLKAAIMHLCKTTLEYNLINKASDKDDWQWGGGALLAWAQYKNGVLEVEFSTRMAELFYSPEIYTKINLLLSTALKSKYSGKFYELALMWLSGRDHGSSGLITVVKMRKLLGVGSGHRLTAYFYKYCIKKAIDEINANPRLNLQITTKRELRRRKVIGWRFTIVRTGSHENNLIEQKVRPNFDTLAGQKEAQEHQDHKSLLTQAITKLGKMSAGDKAILQDRFIRSAPLIITDPPDYSDPSTKQMWHNFLIEQFFPPKEDTE